MDDNSQFTEEERAEAFRQEHARHLRRQTDALESIRMYLGILLALTLVGIVAALFAAASSG